MSDDKRVDDTWVPLLLQWFSVHCRELPWRGGTRRDPYKVWVSEIMLQQTKVEAVRPYYESWMERFPDMETLAAASADEVLRQWQGLGYYSRARNLHQAVQEVVSSYDGKVPSDTAELVKLKGVGAYTAGAIASIAYGRRVAAVDGNVLRVFARLYNIEENILSGAVKKEITDLVDNVMPAACPGAFNEALMDFGAQVCVPRQPHCEGCPLSSHCLARAAGKEAVLPLRLTKKNIPTEDITVVVCTRQRKWLLHRRPEKGLLASMWEFPNAGGAGAEGIGAVTKLLQSVGLSVVVGAAEIAAVKHVFSHKIWRLHVYRAKAVHGHLQAKEDWQWLPVTAYTEVPWAGPHGKITAVL
ncbi:A/G-specific adenine glycosylase [Megasphaera vaginalis (ex Bordigoni et al. 2020)]|uniref:A/G-specific adenine glycosylase n=1 Tax=Megasphaera vaginalis (ex Bordigoni et al. 2020) TaxID=2045301 RepID=UPI000C7A786D|nr:A/G-specific adenine glycosylase [Megasphaera vaginalis (ex Bordigoni et al. 2020)]